VHNLGPKDVARQLGIRSLRRRLGPDRPMVLVHIDQPSNDFNSLFEVLSSDPDRYVLEEANVFPCAIGRSFYEQMLPPGSVHIAWSSYAAVWLRRVRSAIPGHIFSLCNTGAARVAFESQAAEDWEAFCRSGHARCGTARVWWSCFLPSPTTALRVSRVYGSCKYGSERNGG
jgi:SAM dependent carboxyl methyltransferase